MLLGAPGSGKSTVGRELGRRGLRWREWEVVVLERWGSRDAFLAQKADALPALQAEILRWIQEGDGAAVFETTGLSDGAFLDAMEDVTRAYVVRLDVAEDEAMRRVCERPHDEHRRARRRVAQVPVSPSIDSRRISAWPAWRATSSRTWNSTHRRFSPVDGEIESSSSTSARISRFSAMIPS